MRKRMPILSLVALALLALVVAACGEIPTARPGQETAGRPTEACLLCPTLLPYPMPTREPVTPPRLPTATPRTGPPPIVLGEEWVPDPERETYVSTTLVVAPVGDGPGEVGFSWKHYPDGLPIDAEHFTVDARGNIYILDVVNQRVVKFDPQGQFVANIVYSDAVQGAGDLAVDAEGRVYIYDIITFAPTLEELVSKVKLLDPEGKLLWETPVPSWFIDRIIWAMRVDEQGTLWVQGEGGFPNALVIDKQPYSKVAFPLGNAKGPFDLDEDEQKALAVSGHLLPSGKPLIVRTGPSAAYIYDSSGRSIYQVIEGISALDLAGNLYYIQYIQYKDGGAGYTVIKWTPQGQRIASFDLPLGWVRIEGNGTVYCFAIDRETWDAYYVVRAQSK